MTNPYPGLREWAAAHADPPEQAGMLQARQVLELLAELDGVYDTLKLAILNRGPDGNDSAEADEVRDRLDPLYRNYHDGAYQRVAQFSADLYKLEDPKAVELPPCKTPGHRADCDCRWAATGEGGY